MNEVQINKIKKRADEYATSCFPYEKQFLEREAVVKCCVHVVTETIADLEQENKVLAQNLEDTEIINKTYEKRFKDLEKENAELKKKNLDAQDAVTMQMYTNKANKEIADKQLTKAKDLLLRFIELKNKPCAYGHSVNMLLYENISTEAKQFLKDSEVEK